MNNTSSFSYGGDEFYSVERRHQDAEKVHGCFHPLDVA